jgi:ATP-binding cassette, subfamily F, member 3
MAKKVTAPSAPLGDVVLRFDDVSFEYGNQKPILEEVTFSVRKGAKVTLMGQNGAGKSTLFQMITGQLKPDGRVVMDKGTTVAIARQMIPRAELTLSVRDFFASVFASVPRDLDRQIAQVLGVVNLDAPLERTVGSFSGGQQARLLLSQALIQNPDILLLDEPTNNLDHAGINHLVDFLKASPATVLVISHDADFLNSFSTGVLYLDVFTRKVEQYTGNYFSVIKEIAARLERERQANVRIAKEISHRKEQANFFAQKGGHMRDVAKKMRERIDELEDEVVDVRREDKTIRPFTIPCQDDLGRVIIDISGLAIIRKGEPVLRPHKLELRKNEHVHLIGPNGVGKTTLLKSLVAKTAQGVAIQEGVTIGYYSQDFSNIDHDKVVYEVLRDAIRGGSDQELRSHAAGFLIDPEILRTRVGALSEGQKGLVAFASLALTKPGILILDEPTNHINFRHLPVIAKALDAFQGTMILVSHVPEFVKQIRIDHTINLGAL